MPMNLDDFFPTKYMKAAELNGQIHTLNVSHIEAAEVGGEQKPIVHFSDTDKLLVLNKTNALVIAKRHGTDMATWKNFPLEVYPENVTFKGSIVEAIRVRLPLSQATGGLGKPAGMPSAEKETDNDIPF